LRAAKSVSHGNVPNVEGIPEEAAASILDAWNRSDKSADWILWGSKMTTPAVARGYLSGKPVVCDDERIIAVRRTLGLPDGSPTNEEVCKRIAECVNALAGVGDPVEFMSGVRALLLAYVNGECVEDPRNDVRVLSLLGRCVPPQELEQVCPSFE
jgi:hypothetical protein